MGTTETRIESALDCIADDVYLIRELLDDMKTEKEELNEKIVELNKRIDELENPEEATNG